MTETRSVVLRGSIDARLKEGGERLDCVDQLAIPAKIKNKINYVGYCVLKYHENKDRKPVYLVKRIYHVKSKEDGVISYRWSACIVERVCETKDQANAAMHELLNKLKESQ